MNLEDAVRSNHGKTIVNFHIIPGSSNAGYGGYDPWRRCIKVRVRSPPRRGAANEELVTLLSEWFDIERSRIDIVSGRKERSKSVSFDDVDAHQVLEVLKELQKGV